jgi:hypothetical protein
LEFDDTDHESEKKLRSRAVKLLAQAPPRQRKGKVRPWLLAAGAVLIVAAYAVPPGVLAGPAPAPGPTGFVLYSVPKAEVFAGERSLGATPLLVQESQVGQGLSLQAEGYEKATFRLLAPLPEGKVEKHKVVLEAAAVALDWSGLPEGSKLVWQGKPATREALAKAKAGSYSLVVTAPGRPPVSMRVSVPDPSGASGATLAVGKQAEAAFAKQPQLGLSLKSGKVAPKLPLTVSVVQGKFKRTETLDGKGLSKIVLPGPGAYQVKVPATSTHQAFSKSLTLKEGAKQNLEIALTPVPPRIAADPAPAGGGYVPEPVYYSPPPVHYGGGGGGGGGSIAPPSF